MEAHGKFPLDRDRTLLVGPFMRQFVWADGASEPTEVGSPRHMPWPIVVAGSPDSDKAGFPGFKSIEDAITQLPGREQELLESCQSLVSVLRSEEEAAKATPGASSWESVSNDFQEAVSAAIAQR